MDTEIEREGTTALPDELTGDMVVVRFSPFGAERLAEKITKDYLIDVADGRAPLYCVSVFATQPLDGESMEEAADRLCLDLLGVRGAPNGDKIAVLRGEILIDAGFRGVLDEPPWGHYVVGERDLDVMPDTAGLERAFSNRRKNVAFQR